MNISYNWLKDYLQFDLSPEKLSNVLNSIGIETGRIEMIKGGMDKLIVGEVIACKKHSNSERLYITTVNLGDGDFRQIVCGATNVAVGQKVIVATIGATIHYKGKDFTIKKSKIRGVESNGMICSEDEIGVGTNHNNIVVLPKNTKIGMLASEFYQIKDDYIFEIDITPNRIDAFSHYGVARDLAAYLSFRYSPVVASRFSVDSFKIEDISTPVVVAEVENKLACPRYTGVTIKNVQVKESPMWLKKRLETVGVRSINNIVDVSNYILYDIGQPIHVFDLKAVNGMKIFVKTLQNGTSFTTLDGIERNLSDKDLMICNEEKGMCIGGILGGLESSVTEFTKDIFLESAYFNPTCIRRTACFHGLNTDASFRFERGTDPNITLYALKRASLLIKEIAGGVIVGEIQDIYPNKITDQIVELDISKIDALVGVNISENDIRIILKSLEISVLDKNDNKWKLSVPTYRVDVTRDVDVIEEILRIYGYDKIDTKEEVKSIFSPQTFYDRDYELQNIVSEQLTGAGFSEILNNSLTASTYYEDLIFFHSKKCVSLYNPHSLDLNVMRQTLLFGGLESIKYNYNRKSQNLKFYEFGNIYFHIPFQKNRENTSSFLETIKEELHLSLWITGDSIVGNWSCATSRSSVYELKSYVESIFLRLGIFQKKITYNLCNNDIFSSGLFVETFSGKKLGCFGIIQKKICKKFALNKEVYFAELNWNSIVKELVDIKINRVSVPNVPFVRRDLSLLLDKQILFIEIEKISYQAEKTILKEVKLFDVYEGENLPEGKKSYTVSFLLQDNEKTLNDKQIDSAMNRIQKKLESELGIKLRCF
ncbi:MAG: phenylalanine--tRNA ligase subunit beta [Bacteroidales bacterium OttesenSCG-928-I14]|jgi:phenylalanyl-tRNA synthetase beta chain|nr:phenylalanine--tRNA ligase subunit beta [Bacteroidales bacterium OttesenSCG-928-I14]